jgi:hypothetical protein
MFTFVLDQFKAHPPVFIHLFIHSFLYSFYINLIAYNIVKKNPDAQEWHILLITQDIYIYRCIVSISLA